MIKRIFAWLVIGILSTTALAEDRCLVGQRNTTSKIRNEILHCDVTSSDVDVDINALQFTVSTETRDDTCQIVKKETRQGDSSNCRIYFSHREGTKDRNLIQKGHPVSGRPFSGSGRVCKILSDDNIGDRHQRFILILPSNETILIAHNIDIAPRVPALSVGDTISFKGIYERNSKGGVVHWTHRDPRGHHEAGWLEKNGITYQ